MSAKMPDFLVIGAARAGTTALHAYLRQHPEIFMPAHKEPNFFAFEGQTLTCAGPGADYINNSVVDLAKYQALFNGAPAGSTCGEASPLYLYSDTAPERIKFHTPEAKMIVILRNPIEQAYSHFMYATKQCIENEPVFSHALALETERLAQGWQPLFGYSTFPRYGEQLKRYLNLFPRDQFLIRRYEDYQSDPDGLMHDILAEASLSFDLRREPDTFDLLEILELKELDVRALVNPILGTHDHVVVLAYPYHALGVTSFFLNIIILWLGVDHPGI